MACINPIHVISSPITYHTDTKWTTYYRFEMNQKIKYWTIPYDDVFEHNKVKYFGFFVRMGPGSIYKVTLFHCLGVKRIRDIKKHPRFGRWDINTLARPVIYIGDKIGTIDIDTYTDVYSIKTKKLYESNYLAGTRRTILSSNLFPILLNALDNSDDDDGSCDETDGSDEKTEGEETDGSDEKPEDGDGDDGDDDDEKEKEIDDVYSAYCIVANPIDYGYPNDEKNNFNQPLRCKIEICKHVEPITMINDLQSKHYDTLTMYKNILTVHTHRFNALLYYELKGTTDVNGWFKLTKVSIDRIFNDL